MTARYKKPSLNIGMELSYTCIKTGEIVYLQGEEALNTLTGWSDPGSELVFFF